MTTFKKSQDKRPLHQSYSVIVVLACYLALNACATMDSVKILNKESIKSVTVSEDVQLPEKMIYVGDEELAARVVFGVFGLMAAQDDIKKNSDLVKEVMNKSNIDIGKITIDHFKEKLKSSQLFDELRSECADCPKFSLSVRHYGFAQYHGYSSQLRPELGVEGILTSSDDSVLWRRYAFVGPNDKVPMNTLEEYLQEPELMKIALSLASEIVTDDLIEHMKKN